ncbi:MAG: YchF family ATPase [Planctomycetes bacterium]|nr:YchF family ATPase [Planctomycetota bacterium]
MRVALLGLPEAGKGTIFSLLTGRDVPEFRKTGEGVEGHARVSDLRVDRLSAMENPHKTTHAQTEVVLCPDVENGSGAYPWLNEARLCDLLCMVVRAFTTEEVYHPEGSVDAKRDRDLLEAELIFADLDLVEKRLERIATDRKKKKPLPRQVVEEKVLLQCRDLLENNRKLNNLELTAEESDAIASLNFMTLKPLIWCINVDEDQLQGNNGNGGNGNNDSGRNEPVFKISALIEKEIQALESAEERNEYLREIGLKESGLDRLNAAAYDSLGLMSFYTIGKDEVRAWTIRKGTLAPDAGGKIHTDISRGFIRVEVIKYDDLVALGSEQAVKTAGKAQLKGKTYIMEDGDICHFRFNV